MKINKLPRLVSRAVYVFCSNSKTKWPYSILVIGWSNVRSREMAQALIKWVNLWFHDSSMTYIENESGKINVSSNRDCWKRLSEAFVWQCRLYWQQKFHYDGMKFIGTRNQCGECECVCLLICPSIISNLTHGKKYFFVVVFISWATAAAARDWRAFKAHNELEMFTSINEMLLVLISLNFSSNRLFSHI